MKGLWVRLRVLRGFLALVRDPRRTERIFEVAGVLRKHRRAEVARAFRPVLDNPEFQALYRERLNPRLDLETLRRKPPGTFGRAVADFLDENGFEANSFPMLSYEDPVEFFISRIRQSHDLWHVLTGYATDVPGELGLQGFTFAQVGALISPLIISGGLLHLAFRDPAGLKPAFEQIVDGYRRGQRCRSLLHARLDLEWDTDLEEFRRKIGLTPIGSEIIAASPPLQAGYHQRA